MDSDLVERAQTCSKDALQALPRRWAHVQHVAKTADSITTLIESEHALEIVAAAWLHDIGYAEPISNTGFHPLDGARYAEARGFSPIVVSLIAYHTGALVEAAERGLSTELSEISRPPSELLDVLTFADLTTSPTGEPVNAQDRVSEILSRYEPSDPVHQAVTKSAPSLLAAVRRVEQRLTDAETAN